MVSDPDMKPGTEGRLIQQFGGHVHRISRKGEHGYYKKVMNILGKVRNLQIDRLFLEDISVGAGYIVTQFFYCALDAMMDSLSLIKKRKYDKMMESVEL